MGTGEVETGVSGKVVGIGVSRYRMAEDFGRGRE